MFGFTRVRSHQLTAHEYHELKTYYCGLCHALRQDYNLPSAILAGWDGRFMALLVAAQTAPRFTSAKTRCPAVLGLGFNPITGHHIATRYAAAVMIFLMGEKLADNIQDDNSHLAKMLQSLTQKHLDRALEILTELKFPLSEATALRQQQKEVEATMRGQSLAEVTAPSAQAVAMLVAHTAILADMPANFAVLSQIGQGLGRLITLLDACADYRQDVRKNKFNAILATLPAELAATPLSPDFYDAVENFLFIQLQAIRQHTEKLQLTHHQATVENILFMGLYDSTQLALNKFAKNVTPRQNHSPNLQPCPQCSTMSNARFCPQCGANIRH